MKPDFRTYRENVNEENYHQTVREMVDELVDLDATFVRMTEFRDEKVLILDGWKFPPEDQGPEPELKDVIGFGI